MLSIKEIEQNLIIDSKKYKIVLPEASEIPTNLHADIEIIIIEKIDKTKYIYQFLEIRKNKTTLTQAKEFMNQAVYIETMLVYNDQADCMLCGLTYTTADTLRPALQIIKTNPKYSLVSTVLIMNKGGENLFFTDCALNIKPTATQLVSMSQMAVSLALRLEVVKPEVVLLSYSTNGSGAGEDVNRVREAIKILNDSPPDFVYDGEIQFDAAYVREIRKKKFPNTKLSKEHPDIYVFPEINSANIAAKITERLAHYTPIGPFVLGLNKPINDLSRGAEEDDIYNSAIMTILQTKEVF